MLAILAMRLKNLMEATIMLLLVQAYLTTMKVPSFKSSYEHGRNTVKIQSDILELLKDYAVH